MDNTGKTSSGVTSQPDISAAQQTRWRILTIPAIGLLIYLSYLAIGIGIADLYSYTPRQKIEFWQDNQAQPESAELAQALSNIRRSISWAPDNGEYRDIEGLLLYYQALNEQSNGNTPGFTELTNSALNSFRKAAELRPRWPYSQANIALIKSALDQYDQEFEQAIERATRFGPWENAVNISVTTAGFAGWHQLDTQTQKRVLENTERGLKRNIKQIKQQLKAINKLNLACIHIKSGSSRKKLCGY